MGHLDVAAGLRVVAIKRYEYARVDSLATFPSISLYVLITIITVREWGLPIPERFLENIPANMKRLTVK